MERFQFEKPKKKAHLETTPGEETVNDGQHNEDLFDQDEDHAGEKVDLATVKAFDNSTYTGTEDFQELAENKDGEDADFTELLKSVGDNEEARAWLRKNKSKL